MNKYEVRRNYIDKIGKELLDYKKRGFLIFLHRELVENIKQTGFSDKNFGLTIDRTVYYDHDPECDNGYHTKVSDLKKHFETIEIVNPRDIIKLNK